MRRRPERWNGRKVVTRGADNFWRSHQTILMVCPELLTHVKEETEKEASLAKNLRKAREEREAARKNKGGKAKEDP